MQQNTETVTALACSTLGYFFVFLSFLGPPALVANICSPVAAPPGQAPQRTSLKEGGFSDADYCVLNSHYMHFCLLSRCLLVAK